MYSNEDRFRAVKLYFKLGRRLRATIRQLDNPTNNSTIGWCREYELSRDLQLTNLSGWLNTEQIITHYALSHPKLSVGLDSQGDVHLNISTALILVTCFPLPWFFSINKNSVRVPGLTVKLFVSVRVSTYPCLPG